MKKAFSKKCLAAIFALSGAFFSLYSAKADPLRNTTNFNREWKFQLGDPPGADAASFNDTSWESANLPHSFSLPYFAADRFYTGYGWYRKHLAIPRAWSGKHINLEFDGVFQVAQLYVNGQLVGEHKGGYTGFTFDITRALKTGDNLIAVRVNNNWDARLAPRAGEHVFSGGIYRNVRLVITDPIHVTWFGTAVTTPQLSQASGTVNVKTEVANDSSATKSISVKTAILDAAGKTVASAQSSFLLSAGTTQIFDQTTPAIASPKLWSPEHPNLYSVKTTVLDGSKAVDDFTSPLGFRWFKFTADQGFFLNGEHYYFKGANVHQDHAGWGDAVTESGAFRDVKLMKDAGFDFIRGSHYPHAPAFSRACDEVGMLFWQENCFWGTTGFRSPWASSAYPTDPADEPEFEASVKASLRDMIRIHRNHPSVITWSMDNEVFFSSGSVMPKVREFLKKLVTYSHELDNSRPVAISGAQRGEIDKIGDIAGYNGDGARLFVNPGIPNVVAEYGSTITDRPGKYEPGWGDLPATPGADKNANGSWRLPWRSGEVIWCGFDHGSLAGRRFGAMGMVDYFRLPKRQWYWYRNQYLNIPPPSWPTDGVPAALKLTTDKTTLASVDGTDDAQLIVTILDKDGKPISNSPPVTLELISGPGEFPTGRSITFAPDSNIAIRDGQAAIEFRSYYAGTTLIRATSPGLKDATVIITSHGDHKFIPGKTPTVKARPYIPFDPNSPSIALITLGINNPTRASSEATNHSARLANDGNQTTFWQAETPEKEAWFRVDLERIVNLRQTRLTFPSPGHWRYKIEISADGETNWTTLFDQSQTTTESEIRTDAVPGTPPAGRFVRVTITPPAGQPAALTEFTVSGTPS